MEEFAAHLISVEHQHTIKMHQEAGIQVIAVFPSPDHTTREENPLKALMLLAARIEDTLPFLGVVRSHFSFHILKSRFSPVQVLAV
jgi:hypothetical protein